MSPSQVEIPPSNLDASSAPHFCDLPGSIQFAAGTFHIVPGGNNLASLGFLHLPDGFCAHYFGNIPNTRQMRFAPGGELFVASPTTATTGGGAGGLAAVVVLPDDDHDGLADAPTTFLDKLPSTQGLLFANDHLYYQDDTQIKRVPYARGDRQAKGASETVADITVYVSLGHWPKTLDQADDGTIYVTNGGDEDEVCVEPHPFHGGILRLGGALGGTPVAQGFRNPIAIRCEKGKGLCFAAELSQDYSAAVGGREKLVPVRSGDDWGFPCCATKDLPFPDMAVAADCSHVAAESVSFVIGNTPFAFDFEPGLWPAPYRGSIFVPLHGEAGTWYGERIVAIAVDPTTGLPMPGADVDGGPTGALSDFATGWDDFTRTHGRPAVAVFAPDGRLFLGNDNNGDIFWIAPIDLPR